MHRASTISLLVLSFLVCRVACDYSGDCNCKEGQYCSETLCWNCPVNYTSPAGSVGFSSCVCVPGHSLQMLNDQEFCLPSPVGGLRSSSTAENNNQVSNHLRLSGVAADVCEVTINNCTYDGCGLYGSCDAAWACWYQYGTPSCTSTETGKEQCWTCPPIGYVVCPPTCAFDVQRVNCFCATCPAGSYATATITYDKVVLGYAPYLGVSTLSDTKYKAQVCAKCPAGSTSAAGNGSLSSCNICVAGAYRLPKGNCSFCPAGTFSTAVGTMNASTCTLCGAGTYSNSSGSTSCQDCTNKPFNSYYTGPGIMNNCTWSCNTGFVASGTSCVASYSSDDSYSVGSSGLQVIQAYYNTTCLIHGCWVVDLQYAKSRSDTVVVLYLPRKQVGSDGFYTALFNNTFYPSSFPCATKDLSSKAATTCCLPDFISEYRQISSFSVPSTCDVSNLPAFSASDAVSGKFDGMPISTATILPPTSNQPPNLMTIRLQLDNNEVLALSSKVTGTPGVDTVLQLFVGLAQFTPTPTWILDSTTEQILISFEQTSYFTITSSGTDAYTLLSYINLVVNEVRDATNNTRKSQYAAVTFAMNQNYLPNSLTGVIPLTSVRVGKGPTIAEAVWVQSCEAGLTVGYTSRLSQSCGPAVSMCSANYDPTTSFGTINIPLIDANGGNFFDLNDPSSLQNIYAQLTVSVLDNTGKPLVTTLTAALTLQQGGVNTWCYAQSSTTTLEAVVSDVSITVGIAGTSQDLSNLPTLDNIQQNGITSHTVLNSLGSSSIESGLITFAVVGSDAYFGLSGNTGYSLVVEDSISLHIMGDSMAASVDAVLANNGVQMLVDVLSGHASLSPSSALSAVCKSTAAALPASSCVLRYDIHQGAAVAGNAYEVTVGHSADAGAYLQTILGASDYSTALGASFANLIVGKYGLSATRQYKRAFWINPGYTWTGPGTSGTGRFTLSQKVVMLTLVRIDEGGTRRRVLLQSTASASTSEVSASGTSAGVVFGVNPASYLAASLGISANLSSTWNISMSLTPGTACQPFASVAATVRVTLLSYLNTTASPVLDVQITGGDIDTTGIDCTAISSSSTRRAAAAAAGRRAAGGASGVFVTIIVFANTGRVPSIDKAKFLKMPDILFLHSINVPSAIQTATDAPAGGDSAPAASSSGTSGTTVIAGAVGGAAAVVAAAIAAFVWRSRRSSAVREPGAFIVVEEGKVHMVEGSRGSGEGSEGGAGSPARSLVRASIVFEEVKPALVLSEQLPPIVVFDALPLPEQPGREV